MRCLTLARLLRDQGKICVFVMRTHDGHMQETVEGAGFTCRMLHAGDEYIVDPMAPPHATWLGTDWRCDAEQTLAIPEMRETCFVVVDHYSLDARWHRAVRGTKRKIIVIDDLADRVHDCDILIDQNVGRQKSDYDGLVPQNALRLIGPHCAILRPEFSIARKESIARRAAARGPLRVLVTLGGMDADNLTEEVLQVLSQETKLQLGEVSIVLGANSPNVLSVSKTSTSMQVPAHLHVGTDRMAAIMAETDLAIGAGGGSAIERCVLGLPSIILILADNQRSGATAIARCGAAIDIGDTHTNVWQDRLRQALHDLLEPGRLAVMSHRAAELSDGTGARLASLAINEKGLALRPADHGDAEAVWNWRLAEGAERFYLSSQQPTFLEHLDWFDAALSTPDRRRLFMVEIKGRTVAHLRADWDGPDAMISIVVDPALHGQGIGLRALKLIAKFLGPIGVRTLLADVHLQNVASHRLFLRAGYVEIGRSPPFLHMAKICSDTL